MASVEKVVEADDPDVSVIVPTLPSREIQSLEALQQQTFDEFEVIVVEDAQLDVCEARDLGVEGAKADKIALTDDDTNPPENWVEEANTALGDDTVLLEGPIRIQAGNETTVLERSRRYVGCNVAFTETAWRRVGGYDSRYAGWGEDIAFGWEIEREFGLDRCEYSRDFCMTHLGSPKSELDIELDLLLRNHYPERFFHIHRNPPSMKGQIATAVLQATHELSPSVADRVHPFLVR